MTVTDAARITEVPVELIRPNPLNPRRELGDLDPLANSMSEIGLAQEILVMEPDDEGFYVLLAGHRRTAAAQMLGWMTIPASIRPVLDEPAQLEMLLAANANAGLSPIEEAAAFDSLVKTGKSQREVANRVGCDQSHVSRRLELLKLSPEDQERVHEGKLTVGKALKSLKPPKEKATPAEPVTVPVELLPDPIDAMEPIGYKVIELNSEGEYVDNWDATIYATADAARADATNVTRNDEPLNLVPVALVLLPPVETISTEADVATGEPSPSDEVGSVAGGEEEGLTVPASEQVEADAGPSATEELSEEGRAALVHFARTWAAIPAADEVTVRESAEHEFGELSREANLAVDLWVKAREQMAQRQAS